MSKAYCVSKTPQVLIYYLIEKIIIYNLSCHSLEPCPSKTMYFDWVDISGFWKGRRCYQSWKQLLGWFWKVNCHVPHRPRKSVKMMKTACAHVYVGKLPQHKANSHRSNKRQQTPTPTFKILIDINLTPTKNWWWVTSSTFIIVFSHDASKQTHKT